MSKEIVLSYGDTAEGPLEDGALVIIPKLDVSYITKQDLEKMLALFDGEGRGDE